MELCKSLLSPAPSLPLAWWQTEQPRARPWLSASVDLRLLRSLPMAPAQGCQDCPRHSATSLLCPQSPHQDWPTAGSPKICAELMNALLGVGEEEEEEENGRCGGSKESCYLFWTWTDGWVVGRGRRTASAGQGVMGGECGSVCQVALFLALRKHSLGSGLKQTRGLVTWGSVWEQPCKPGT